MVTTIRLGLISLALLGACAGPSGAEPSVIKRRSAAWKQVDAKEKEQKLEDASKIVLQILADARKANDDSELTEALVEATRLRVALGGYETAVRFLKDEPWPKSGLPRDLLQLYYAQSLLTYVDNYSWEIRRREKVATAGPVDLKHWTEAQIVAEATRAFAEVWNHRSDLDRVAVTSLPDMVVANNYPREIRGTLRDALTYLAAQLFGNSSRWQPGQDAAVWQLDLGAFLDGDAAALGVNLEDDKVHPLKKAMAVLADLEAWHKRAGRREAALEAQLTRLEQLHTHFTVAADRERVMKVLVKALDEHRNVTWWARGKALQARWIEEDDGDRVRAHAIAVEGWRAYPQSVGGQLCLHILKQIETPEFSLEMPFSDAPKQRSIQVTHKDISRLYFRAWPFDVKARIATAKDYNLLPSGDELKKLMRAGAAYDWRADLPETPDYQQHKTFVTPPIDKPGIWLVAASAKADFSEPKNHVLAAFVVVGDLVLEDRADDQSIVARVVEAGSGKPAADVTVSLYRFDWRTGHHLAGKATTDGAGEARIDASEAASYFVIAERGGDIALDTSGQYLSHSSPTTTTAAALIYTDRSVYRPEQTLMWKVVAYHGRADDGKFAVTPQTSLTVSLRDPNNQEVAKVDVRTNEYGSASGQFKIPAGRPLGGWRLQTGYGSGGSQSVRVEEYKRPTFEVRFPDATDGKAEVLRLGRPATFAGEAKYYFGLPVTSGAVAWRVTRDPVYPWWWGWWGRPTSGTQTVAAGTAKVGDDGVFKVTFTPEADSREDKSVSYRYRVAADLTDEGGETRSAERSFQLGWVTVAANISEPSGFFTSGAGELTVTRTNLDGVPRAGAGSYRILALQQPATALLPAEQPLPVPPSSNPKKNTETPGDKLRSRASPSYSPEAVIGQWSDGAVAAEGALSHDDKGAAQVSVAKLAPGAYRLRYRTLDDFGAAVEAWHDFIVAGAQPKLALPAILLAADHTVTVGGTAHLLAWSGVPGAPMAFDVYRAGKLIQHQTLVGGAGNGIVDLPITDADRGGLAITLTMVRDHQLVSLREVIAVPWDDKQLDVAFATFRDKLRPGAKETFRVTVRGKGAHAPLAGVELLAYMYDRSLDVFAPHSPPSPMSLYPSRAQSPWWRTTLGSANVQWIFSQPLSDVPYAPSLSGDSLILYSGYGAGGPGVRGGHLARSRYAVTDAPTMMPGAPAPGPMAKPAEADESGGERTKSEEGNMGKRREVQDVTTGKKLSSSTGDAAPLRSNFAETAFFQPHLIAGKDGSASFEFTVPDSVTSWNVWVHALTRDMASGSVTKETRSVKDLLVRPYVPRFFREGDMAELKVVVNNAGDKPLSGSLTLDILDPASKKTRAALFGIKDAARNFTVEPGKSANVTFAMTAPKAVGSYAFVVRAKAGQFSDGEARPVPVLPSRLHLAQSRFVTLRDKSKKTLSFADMAKNDDPTLVNEKLVVTVDAQLFYSMLNALPYLVEYPYECTEQTLNRFVSTGIVSSMQAKYPAIAKMSAELAAKRSTPLERFDAPDPNRRMTLEESPWLVEAQGGDTSAPTLKILDPEVAKAQRDDALGKLGRAQTSSGGFPWFAGGPPSPYITLYLMSGFARAASFGVALPKDMVQRGWVYLAAHYRDEYANKMMAKDYGWEFLTFLNYTASSYPDDSWTGNALTTDERKTMLDFSFKHWKQHSPYLKGMLAVTLKRAGRDKDAKLVWDSVMDAAKTSEELGTYWAPEDRSWLWYNDTIETQAFALRVLMELDPSAKPDTPMAKKMDGLVLWLMLNKKLNHWKSTRATAEVLFTLATYLTRQQTLGIREEASVTVGGATKKLVFEPDHFEGKKQIVVDGAAIQPARDSQIVVEKSTKGIMFASATWHFATDKLPTEDRGDFFNVSRAYFLRVQEGGQWTLRPIADGTEIKVGDQIEVQLSIRSKHAAEYVHLRDPRGAGFEPENQRSGWAWDGVVRYEEVRDSGANFFFEQLPVGEYTFKYRLRANMAGKFRVGPATIQSIYAPEFNAYSTGTTLTVR